MDQILITDYNSNSYFFLTGFTGTFFSGKNSFVVNRTPYIIPGEPITASVQDSLGNTVPCNIVSSQYGKYPEQTTSGYVYHCFIPETTLPGIGKIKIQSVGIDVGDYTGSIAYYQGNAYPVGASMRLPLIQPPAASPFKKFGITWINNILIDVTQQTEAATRFFDFPKIDAKAELYKAPIYSGVIYKMASGSLSAMAVVPKNNLSGDYDYQLNAPLYQMYLKSGTRFLPSMEGEMVRIKNPRIKKFVYSTLSNNRVVRENIRLNTDFIAEIARVVNETSILLRIPFIAVAELVNLVNEDSPYAKNNLVDIKGYVINNDPVKQGMFHKKNFYALSIDDGEYEICYKDIQTVVQSAPDTKCLLNIECSNLRLLCGALNTYKLYGKSLNSPETPTLICEGKIEADEHIVTTKFNNGFYNFPGNFYDSTHLSAYWLKSGSFTFAQSSSTLSAGALISHTSNLNQSDYVIFKDNTHSSRTPQYISYTLASSSYWYAKSDAFVNYSVYPTASYSAITGIPVLSSYVGSQENLLSGMVHDSNPIKLRQHTLYQFSMRVRSAALNSSTSKLYVYFISGNNRTQIGYIDNSHNYGADESYTNTFFNLASAYGTIIIVPVSGEWNIASVSLKPYKNTDYSVDSFAIKVPYKGFTPNELIEIELELYDSAGVLAYGRNSNAFQYNKSFLPLKKQIFINPV
jgi:hypothetical protein